MQVQIKISRRDLQGIGGGKTRHCRQETKPSHGMASIAFGGRFTCPRRWRPARSRSSSISMRSWRCRKQTLWQQTRLTAICVRVHTWESGSFHILTGLLVEAVETDLNILEAPYYGPRILETTTSVGPSPGFLLGASPLPQRSWRGVGCSSA